MIKTLLGTLALSASVLFSVPVSASESCVSSYEGYTMCFSITGQHVNWDRWLLEYSDDRNDVTLDVLCNNTGRGMVMDWKVVKGEISDRDAEDVVGLFCQN